MIITGSDITMAGSHVATERYIRRESLAMRIGPGPSHGDRRRDSVDISGEARRAGEGKEKRCGCADNGEETRLEPRLQLLKSIIERITGWKIKLMDNPSATKEGGDGEEKKAPPAAREGRGSAGFALAYDYYESYRETESTSFSAAGVINTADGRQIAFSLDLAMERSFESETAISIRAGDAVRKDPLVINFDGTAAQLADSRFFFDIDADGVDDSLASLGGGSGFLALDKNGDGVINDGSELFGTKSGNGFADLAGYDLDGNSWIDENDAVFNELSVWMNPGGENASLLSLKESGVGAIYLGNVATPFQLNDAANNELGEVKASGIYLAESGEVGTIQQLDLAI